MSREGQGRIYGAETASVTLNAVEINALADFAKAHEQCTKTGGYPQRFSLTSTANGIAASLEVVCLGCQARESISDVDSW